MPTQIDHALSCSRTARQRAAPSTHLTAEAEKPTVNWQAPSKQLY
jgi:hypothetical protein